MIRLRLFLLLLAALLAAGGVQARRVALVIGNDQYVKVARLDRAGADAEAVARELGAAGFEVSLHRDLTNTRFAVVVSEFYDKVRKGDEVVVFYAGHGVQTERGAQLLPVDIEGDTEFVVERLSQPVNGLLDSLERLQPRVALVIIDACRDNPLRAQGRPIGAARGLSGPNVARGQMLMFSAASRERALDSLGKDDKNPNGVFTRELVSRMRKPGIPFEQLAKEVQDAVERLAETVKHKQRPLIVNDSIGDFAFYPGAGAAAPVQAAAPAAADASQVAAAREDRFWDGVLKADTVDAYKGYLERYPQGEYAVIARAAIAKQSERPATVVAQNQTRGAREEAPVAPAATPPAAPAAVAPRHRPRRSWPRPPRRRPCRRRPAPPWRHRRRRSPPPRPSRRPPPRRLPRRRRRPRRRRPRHSAPATRCPTATATKARCATTSAVAAGPTCSPTATATRASSSTTSSWGAG
ncbi:MAG: caspase family protein [Rubrivivax sp.]